MGKILIRIYPEEFASKAPTLIDKSIDVVCKNGTVIHGLLVSCENESLTLRNNHYRRKHTANFSEISEIVIDQEK
ncbi:MAG: hypothetical protein GY827_10490 [Cytophagales bacterium]|nr:hypothetical protein [Cytophagales bacterium]